MKLNRKWLLVIALVLSLTMATAGTLAYLTDRDTVENTFTMGNVDIKVEEEYEQDSELNPGVEVEKQAGVKNVHATTDAWVWMTVSVPTDMVPYINLEWLDGTPVDNATRTDVHEGYTSYVVKHPDVLKPGQSTPKYLQGVTLSETVDYQGGQYGYIEDGVFVPFETMPDPMMIIVDGFAVQTEGFNGVAAAYEAYEDQWGDDEPGEEVEYLHWNGTSDTSWYNDTDTEFVLTTPEQLAGLAELVDGGNTFAGKTVKLGASFCLGYLGYDDNCNDPSHAVGETDPNEPRSFNPIGNNSSQVFKGTFDGQNNEIKNLYQNGWALGYESGKYGSVSLFSQVTDATVKNLTMTGAEILVEGGDVAGIAGSSTGTCVFENITIEASNIATYNNACAGIVGWSGAGSYTFKDITIEDDVVLTGLWGSFDSSVGGIVGQAEPGATYDFEDVEINCCLNVFNDCTASYDYYNYRMCGMIMGRLEATTTIDGANYPDTSKYNITCDDVTVNYGDWMNYHYCDPTPGYNGGRGMRVEPGYSYGGLPADYDHSQCTTHHNELIPFDQIFGGAQYAVKGLKSYTGVTVNYPD